MLQQPAFDFFEQPDTGSSTTVLLIIGAVFLVGIVGAYISSKTGGTSGSRSFSKMRFRREGKNLGLSPHHIRMLLSVVERLRIQNPHRLYREPSFLTNALARGIQLIDQDHNLTDEERENQKDLLFQVKRIVQINMGRQRTIGSSKRLRTGRQIRVTSDGSEWYDTVITSNLEDVLGVEYPIDERDRPVKWGKGTKVKVALVTEETEKMYTFDSRVVGVTRSKGVTSLLLAHSDQIQEVQNRKYPRRSSDRPVYFWPVAVVTVGSGKHQQRQAVISNNRRGDGRLEDISAGGCAIRTTGALKAGTLIKIQFETPDGSRLAVFGKVLSTDKGRGRYLVMHIKFTRVSRKNLNKIQAYVYGLVEDDEEVIS